MLLKVDGDPCNRAICVKREVSDQKTTCVGVAPTSIAPHVHTRPGWRSKRRAGGSFIFSTAKFLSLRRTEIESPKLAVTWGVKQDRYIVCGVGDRECAVGWRERLCDASANIIPGLAHQRKKRLLRRSRGKAAKRKREDKTIETQTHGITPGSESRGEA